MATLYERNGRFYVNYSLGCRRVRKALGTDRETAELYLKELNYRLFKGDFKLNRSKFPITYAISQYLKSCEVRIANSTSTRYKNALTHFHNYILNYYPVQNIDQINRMMISDYGGYRLKCIPKPKRKTINNEIGVIRAFLNFAVDSGYIETNPASKIKMLPVTDSKKGQIYSPEDIELLLSVCGKWFSDVVLVFLSTGMRLGELTNLTWDDIDLKGNTIKIQEKEGWSPKSYSRTIPMNKRVREIITHQPHYHYIFTHKGKKIKPNYLRKRLIKYSKMVGLNYSRIHDLRHTFCSSLLNKGIPIPVVCELMGHKDWKTTQIYGHPTEKLMKEAVETL